MKFTAHNVASLFKVPPAGQGARSLTKWVCKTSSCPARCPAPSDRLDRSHEGQANGQTPHLQTEATRNHRGERAPPRAVDARTIDGVRLYRSRFDHVRRQDAGEANRQRRGAPVASVRRLKFAAGAAGTRSLQISREVRRPLAIQPSLRLWVPLSRASANSPASSNCAGVGAVIGRNLKWLA